jgi:UDP:flavonoid glycosyltransferase YjiC (YdhE family)
MTHLYIAVTAHGYGHLAQVAPIANALRERLPDLRITLQGTVSEDYVRARLQGAFRHVPVAADVALPMDGPLHARWDEGLAIYSAFDRDHEQQLTRQQALLAEDPPDLLLADIPWIPLEAARCMGIACVGVCSLSWYDILAESPVGPRMPPSLVEHMRSAYAGADLFIRPAPTMPMSWLPNGADIGPIAVRRRRDPAGVRAHYGLPDDRRLVLMQFGGAGRLHLGRSQPLPASVHLLTPDPAAADGRDDITVISGADVLDVLASCDAMITKPGYGTFAEAACNGIPVLYVPRGDWPEEPHLVEWLEQRVPTRAVTKDALAEGRIAEPLSELLAAGVAEPVSPTGTAQAVELLHDLLR